MAATSGIWMHGAGASPRANATDPGGSGSNNTSSATISANDFLTLLVSEMRNQDPTAATDPNEYINQLVNVNSLQQLISINQTLSAATAVPAQAVSTAGGSQSESQADSSSNRGRLVDSGPTAAKAAGSAMISIGAKQGIAATSIPGNLSLPKASAAGNAVAHALARH